MTQNEKFQHNNKVCKKLNNDAILTEVSERTIELAMAEIERRLEKKHDVPISITKNGKEVFVCWLTKWRDDYDVTVMGRVMICTTSFKEACKRVCQLTIAHKNNDYNFIYG